MGSDMENNVKSFLEEIRSRGYKMHEIAKQLELSQSTLSNWIRRGHIPPSKYLIVSRLAKECEVQISDTLFWPDSNIFLS